MTRRFDDALLLASELHRSQLRKGIDVAYISHLMAVASLVIEQGGTEDQAIAGLLHDAVEDAGGLETLERIRDQFGDAVADIVDACTDSYEEPKPPWKGRKEAYIASISKKNDAARLVSCADKLHNARSILWDFREVGDELWPRFSADKADVIWYYRSLANIFLKSGPTPLAKELDRVVQEIEALSN